MKRIFDLIFAIVGLLIIWPILFAIAILIYLDNPGPVFFVQQRVGKGGVEFGLLKFRTMKSGSEKGGLLTVGSKDSRITRMGYYLRKVKLDELPQLINVVKGDMSFVGPRPEVRKYVELYDKNQQKVLSVRPGITDVASLEYFDENDILSKSNDPEKAYKEEIMPHKLQLNMAYIERRNLITDIGVILRTILKIFR